MKILGLIKNILKENKPILKKKFKIKEIGIFGSYARNEQEENSDLDILIEFYEPISFFTFIDIEEYLTELLGIKVDLVSKKALKPRIGKFILDELILI
ncbi:MAG: nucleotidyltransferase family protein [Armatimonadetes bacterium]|nr:nucleotidyltransferase family protein [Armatimonadota bacterium]